MTCSFDTGQWRRREKGAMMASMRKAAAHKLDDDVLSAVAGHFAVLAEPVRLRILHALCHGERSVGRLVADTGLSQSTVSRNLALMHRRGLASRRREGKQVIYRIADQATLAICRAVCRRIARSMEERGPMRRRLLALIPDRAARAG
jgi:DNA-binding transcriptional ArsR family regulator